MFNPTRTSINDMAPKTVRAKLMSDASNAASTVVIHIVIRVVSIVRLSAMK